MEWNAFDICEAWNLFALNYGRFDIKARLNHMQFRCAPRAEFYKGLTDNAARIYDDLARVADAATVARIKARVYDRPGVMVM